MLTKNCLTRYICVNYRNLNGVGFLRQRHGKRVRNIFKFPSQKTIIETFLGAIWLHNVEKKFKMMSGQNVCFHLSFLPYPNSRQFLVF